MVVKEWWIDFWIVVMWVWWMGLEKSLRFLAELLNTSRTFATGFLVLRGVLV